MRWRRSTRRAIDAIVRPLGLDLTTQIQWEEGVRGRPGDEAMLLPTAHDRREIERRRIEPECALPVERAQCHARQA